MSDLTKSIERKLQSRYANKDSLRKGAVNRFDLKLWDHQVVGPHEARVLIGYTAGMGMPKRSEVDQWVIKAFSGSVRTVLETIRPISDQTLLIAHVIKIPEVRPTSHTAAMVQVSASTFMDDNEQVWERRKNGEGGEFIARVSKEDLDELLKAYERESKTAAVSTRPRLASAGQGDLLVEEGDQISFTLRGMAMSGVVTAMLDDDNLKVTANNSSFVIHSGTIFDVKKVNAKTQKMSDEEYIDFYARAYGNKDYAVELVKGTKPKK